MVWNLSEEAYDYSKLDDQVCVWVRILLYSALHTHIQSLLVCHQKRCSPPLSLAHPQTNTSPTTQRP